MNVLWKNEVSKIKQLLLEDHTLESIGEFYGVSRQRIYQVLTKFGIETPQRKKKNFLVDLEPKFYWLNKMLCKVKVSKLERLEILQTLPLPDICPMLEETLNYNGTGREGYSRGEYSPSLDRIDSTKGYTKDNIQVISWRANRIKNDSTPEELIKIGTYMSNLTK